MFEAVGTTTTGLTSAARHGETGCDNECPMYIVHNLIDALHERLGSTTARFLLVFYTHKVVDDFFAQRTPCAVYTGQPCHNLLPQKFDWQSVPHLLRASGNCCSNNIVAAVIAAM